MPVPGQFQNLPKVCHEKKFTTSGSVLLLIKVSPIIQFFSAFLDILCTYIVSKGQPKILKIEALLVPLKNCLKCNDYQLQLHEISMITNFEF